MTIRHETLRALREEHRLRRVLRAALPDHPAPRTIAPETTWSALSDDELVRVLRVIERETYATAPLLPRRRHRAARARAPRRAHVSRRTARAESDSGGDEPPGARLAEHTAEARHG